MWYQVKVKYDKMNEDGEQKKTTELYLIQAESFAEAERGIIEQLVEYIRGELDIVDITRKNYREIILDDFDIASQADGEARRILGQKNPSIEADKWFKCKLNFTTLDEKSGREKKTAYYYLVNANTAMTAHKLVDNFMRGSMEDYSVEQVDETKILEVYKRTERG